MVAEGSNEPATIHRFGEVEVDEAQRQVRRRGAVVAVEPKPFELLVYLIRQRHRVVPRDELMHVLWPDVVVSEATLSSAVRRARAAIAPASEAIQGLRKVGYRFVGEVHSGVAEESQVRLPPELPAASPASTYIGRPQQLDELSQALARGLGGRGGVLALAGEPGIGKTCTVDELVRRARDGGAEVLVGRCYEGDGGQAFWPWLQVFRAFAAHRSDAELANLLGAEAADLARLTAAVAVAPESASLADPEMVRSRLLDAATVVLRRAAVRSPVVVVLDDVHWADHASLTLLHCLARQLAQVPLVVVLTYRELEIAAPLASLLTTLRRESLVQVTALRGLSQEEARQLLQAAAGGPVSLALATTAFAVSEGNPLFLLEYWRDLQEAGSVVAGADGWQRREDSAPWSVPANVAEIIDRRLRRLSPECVRLLAIGAVMGREFEHAVVGEVSTTSQRETIDLLDQAAAARVVEEVGTSPGRYRFAHALIRQTLYDNMTALRRAALHRYVGEALEARSGEVSTRERIAELAHHFLLAGHMGGGSKAIDYAERAAIEATQSCAYDAAVAYLEQAVALADDLASTGDSIAARRRAELHVAWAEALGRAGLGEPMRSRFAHAAELARALPAPDLLARVAIGVARHSILEDEGAVQLCEEALSLLPESAVGLRARLQASLAKVLYLFDGTRARRERLCSEARGAAAECGEPEVLGDVIADCLEAQFNTDGLADQDDLAAALCAAAEAAADGRQRLLGRAWQIVNSMRRGQLIEAERRLQEFSRLAAELRQPRYLAHAAAFDAALLLARGDLAAAEVRTAEGLRLGERIDEAPAVWLHWTQMLHLRREQGRFAEFLGEGLALRLPPGTKAALSYQRSYRWVAPHLFSELGREAEAKESFAALMASGLEGLPSDNARNTRIPALFSLADTCATVGDADAAAQIYAVAEPYADQWHVIGWGSVVFASVHMMLGALAGTQRRWAPARDHFEEALRLHEEQGAVCAQARALYQFARVLQRRGRPADLRQATECIDRGLAICERFGLRGAEVRLRRLHAEG